MGKMLLVSFISALIYTLIIAVTIKVVRRDWDDFFDRIWYVIVSFFVEFVWIIIFLYVSCKPQTILIALIWMWPALAVNWIISSCTSKCWTMENVVGIVVFAIPLMVCIFSSFGVVQNLIYVHDMEDVEVAYTVSSDEILAKVELKIDNSDWREKYDVDSPEIRHVGEKDIAVYHIKDGQASRGNNGTEYIPGYAIQESEELPKIIGKRIYFDTSYVNKKDALRTVRRWYPTVIIGKGKFDIDDSWNPYMVYEYREKLFSSNGEDYGLIILNLMNGSCNKYPIFENNVPAWVDFTTTYPR